MLPPSVERESGSRTSCPSLPGYTKRTDNFSVPLEVQWEFNHPALCCSEDTGAVTLTITNASSEDMPMFGFKRRQKQAPIQPFAPPPKAPWWRVLAELIAYVSSNGRYVRGIILAFATLVAVVAAAHRHASGATSVARVHNSTR
jgi:hypothetical protein